MALTIDDLPQKGPSSPFSSFFFQSKECVELREYTIKKGILCGGTPAKTNNTNTHDKKDLTSKRVDLMTYAAA